MTEVRLGYTPRPWQRACHLARRRFSVLALHRRAGKTEMALMVLIDEALKCKDELGFYAYLAPMLKQAKVIAWKRLKARLEPLLISGGCEFNEGDLLVTFKHNGSVIRLFGGDNPDALRGVRLDGCVLDEVGQMKPELWQDILQPALSDRLGFALFIGTPSGINLFSELYHRASTLPDWNAARYTVYDTNAIDPAEVERLKRDMPETAFAREYLCDFNAAGDDQLISLSDVEMASKRVYTDKDVLDAPKILGVDPARFGDDRSVVVKRQGLQAYTPYVYRGVDNMELAARVVAIIEQWEPDAVFIDSGAGAGVIDRLRQLDYDVIEVPFGGRAVQSTQYVNRRTEMWWEMREWLGAGGAIPSDSTLKSELSTPIYWYDQQGRKMLEAKDDIKKRLQGGASPDIADALALTFAHPVRRRTIKQMAQATKRAERDDYDPYAKVT